jgi:hypothetical protein
MVNQTVGFDAQFWATATCRDAYEQFVGIAIDVFASQEFSGAPDDPLWLQDEDLAFQLFQIPILTFAYSASGQRRQRQFMGIRKGLFG